LIGAVCMVMVSLLPEGSVAPILFLGRGRIGASCQRTRPAMVMVSLLPGGYVVSRRLLGRGLIGAFCRRIRPAMVMVSLLPEGSVASSRLLGRGRIDGSYWLMRQVAPAAAVLVVEGIWSAYQSDSSYRPEVL